MSEQTDAPATDAPETPDVTEPKPAETVEFWREKAREQEKRAKANAAAAKQLEAIEEASKTEAQKAADSLAAAQRDAEEARAEALRYRIASKFQIGDEDAALFLTGTDEETLTTQAKRLSDREAERKKTGNRVPKEGNPSQPGTDEMREFTRKLFNRGE